MVGDAVGVLVAGYVPDRHGTGQALLQKYRDRFVHEATGAGFLEKVLIPDLARYLA